MAGSHLDGLQGGRGEPGGLALHFAVEGLRATRGIAGMPFALCDDVEDLLVAQPEAAPAADVDLGRRRPPSRWQRTLGIQADRD
jgi:hypothetical protein